MEFTKKKQQLLSSQLLGKFTVETDTLLKVVPRPGVTAGRAGAQDYQPRSLSSGARMNGVI